MLMSMLIPRRLLPSHAVAFLGVWCRRAGFLCPASLRILSVSPVLPPSLSLEAGSGSRPQTPLRVGSPTWSTASTADAGPSPSLPALPAPRLPERVLDLLRTPPSTAARQASSENDDGNNDESRFVTASWGSPYPRSDRSHLPSSSPGSEPSEDSPIHHLELHTPFLRPAPFFPDLGEIDEDEDSISSHDDDRLSSSPFLSQPNSSLVTATVLANRARRPARGLTEDWIRQHTTGDFHSEARLWLSDSDSQEDSETSSLSGSVSGRRPSHPKEEDDELALRTPRAVLLNNRQHQSPSGVVPSAPTPSQRSSRHARYESSIETLRESDLKHLDQRGLTPRRNPSQPENVDSAAMGTSPGAHRAAGSVSNDTASLVAPATPQQSKSVVVSGTTDAVPPLLPSTPPQKAASQRGASGIQPDVSLDPLGELAVSKVSASPRKTPRRSKKKLPWKGKSIVVLLPLDEQRGKPGKAPKPLTQTKVDHMLHSWDELGYDIKGFDLDRSITPNDFDYYDVSSRSMSRPTWPDEHEVAHERALRKYPVQLPDLNAWKNYVEELNEAKLRALGVSFGDEEPPLPPSISPGAGASISRQSSATVYPPLPFSPPIPTSSASSNHNMPPFAFPPPFVPGAANMVGSSATQSPAIPSTASPIPFGIGAKYNARQSISIPAGAFQMPPLQTTPGGFSPQALLLQQGMARGGSPSLAALSSVMSPTSPFTPDSGFTSPPLHQRHQSLQYPLIQYAQMQTSARASPRLQDLREVEEEVEEKIHNKSPSKTPETNAARPLVQHNASPSLQKEIDDAEYHLEEQFRSQFEHDRDYSPHGGRDPSYAFGANAAKNPTVPQHGRGLSVQFAAAPIQRFRDDAEGGPPLHHPRPHSRGHSLANAYYAEPEEARNGVNGGGFAAAANLGPAAVQHNLQNKVRPDDAFEIETNPSNLGTPIQGLDYGSMLQQQHDQKKHAHQRAFSTASNPWSDNGSFSGKRSSTRQPSHGSKASLSNLNVEAPEFKFNPGASAVFQPSLGSQFSFGNNPTAEPFQPTIFQAGLAPNAPPSANSSQFSFPSLSKINVNAPTFSPGQSEFSFSASGPKFRPDAPAFMPTHSFTDSLTSPIQSGGESIGGNRPNSIFGNIDLNIPDVIKPAKRSKAVPIVRPSSGQSLKPAVSNDNDENEPRYDLEGRVKDDSRVKRARATTDDDGNDEVLFAEPSNNDLTVPSASPQPEPTAVNFGTDAINDGTQDETHLNSGEAEAVDADAQEVKADEDVPDSETPHAEILVDDTARATEKANDDEGESAAAEDTTLSSTVLSESTDAAKLPTTASPSDLSPLPGTIPWRPFEFGTDTDVADFNSARPMSEDVFTHAKTLSATAKPFTPGASFQGAVVEGLSDDLLPSQDVLPTIEVAHEEPQVIIAPPAPASPKRKAQSPPPPPPPPAAEKPRGLAASRYATASPPPPPPKSIGLSGSRFATASPPPVPSKDTEPNAMEGQQLLDESSMGVVALDAGAADYEPTFEEIDDIMRHLTEDPTQGVNKLLDSASWHQAPALVQDSLATHTDQDLVDIPAPGPSHAYNQDALEEPQEPVSPTELKDPFIDALDGRSLVNRGHASGGSMPPSEWEGDFGGEEQLKLESRVNYFDGHVNDVVGGILAARLDPLQKSLEHIQSALTSLSRRSASSRRDCRSASAEVQESDADDEDDDTLPVRRPSSSPRRDRRMEQMRAVVLDALANHTLSTPPQAAASAAVGLSDESVATILKSLEDVKEHFGQARHLDSRTDDLRSIVEEALERRIPAVPSMATAASLEADDEADKKSVEIQARISELEERLRLEEARAESEMASRRAADDLAAELRRKLELAETKIEVEIMNRSAYDQRVADLEDRLKHQEDKTESEVLTRRAAEDRLAEVQRLLRISSEEETRLREAVDERDAKLKTLDETSEQGRVRIAVLEASQVNSEKAHADLQNRINSVESELHEKMQESRHWRTEAERAIDLSQRQDNDLMQTATELRHVKKVVDTLGTQLEENERLREAWRNKFIALQDDMARAAREVADESAQHIKREQTLLARHDVLDAKLQAEARTRERLESELERLESGERQAMRAVSECKRLDGLIGELRTENHKLQQSSLRYQTEFEEARESAAREVQRTRDSMQAEVDEANHQVNVVRGELEDQVVRVRSQLDQVKMDSDTAKARLEMLLEEAETTKRAALDDAETAKRSALAEAEQRHQNDVEDLQARYERQITNATEDAQRAEHHLLERLSISTSKTEHLQERVAHLEEKLEIAREAAQAAAKAAKASPAVDAASTSAAVSLQPTAVVQAMHHNQGLPEKISPQALRESILVLQEQLQEREHRIEELEHTLEKVDPEADVKIAKRDDEIIWLRELLAVRHSDLKDIITALGRDDHDPDRVRDAVIRLQANLQMEEQERERAMNGGSAINLPNIAASIRDAATPRVAQAVGPLAAAWGNWRKARDSNASSGFGSLSGALLSSPAPASASASRSRRGTATSNASVTPSRAASSSVSSRTGASASQSATGDSSFLSGLLTPPTSGMRQTPPTRQLRQSDQPQQQQQQPTAFSSTGRRYTGEQTTSRRSSRADKVAVRDLASTPPPQPANRRSSRSQPVTPPMHTSAYDSDAQAEEFDDAAFFDD